MKIVRIKSFLAFALWLVSAPVVAADFYRWVDEKGVVHFTDNVHNIP
jgi:hypothetical protein